MNNDQRYMQELADNLWVYFRPKIEERLQNVITFYRAYVSTPFDNEKNVIGVKRPFDIQEVFLPCAHSLHNAQVDDQVTVVIFGKNKNNSFVVGNGSLSSVLEKL